MRHIFDFLGFAAVVTVIIGCIVLFSGEPDIADGIRCRYLEIPMSDYKAQPSK